MGRIRILVLAEYLVSRTMLSILSDKFSCCAAVPDDFSITMPTASEMATGDAIGVLPTLLRKSSSVTEDQEKERLKLVVRRFVHQALRGCQCTYIDEGTGLRVSTEYRVDMKLTSLIIVPMPGLKPITCAFDHIEDIFSIKDDGEDAFPTRVLAALKPGEKELLQMVRFRGDRDELLSFCVIEESMAARDAFMESVRVLCMYGQPQKA